jgi:hypothetical protein
MGCDMDAAGSLYFVFAFAAAAIHSQSLPECQKE